MRTRDFKIIVFFTTARMTQFAAELFNKMNIEARKEGGQWNGMGSSG
jgi:hypothetical protein